MVIRNLLDSMQISGEEERSTTSGLGRVRLNFCFALNPPLTGTHALGPFLDPNGVTVCLLWGTN